MKYLKIPMVILIMIALLCGCTAKNETKINKADPTIPETAPAETQKEEQTPPVIESMTGEGFLTPESKESGEPCTVRILRIRDEAETEYEVYYLYLEVDTGTQVLQRKMAECFSFTGPRGDSMYFEDMDGDGTDELIFHHDTGGCGGAGSFRSWVLKVQGQELQVLFEDPKSNDPLSDFGFKSRMIDGYQMEVTNSITGYQLVFEARRYEKYCFDENGKPTSDCPFIVDSLFYQFEPQDWDEDGISEIVAKRHTSIRGRSDGVGVACCVLKFNTDTQKFELIEAWYEPADDINQPKS